ncbi:MAG: Glutamate 5-kinase [Candidatus Tokpelaia hoelldobleri]|uniref:Glutamate 5-kinase n=1 Tax=Candidatus Tokpelaia hoelldobleri TaxID=1902579 RepID=A0A1U9JVB4_9HYPH|nr:MAG: Glutamate 5-kinase [Candidatus Tokpelaia hoelldoblerii]
MQSRSLQALAHYRRIVVKIGSALLVDRQSGLRTQWLQSLAADIAALAKAGTQVLVVSSGAIALGRTLLSFPCRHLRLEESQACASVGQIELARAYADHLGAYDLHAGQILLTLADTEERRRYLNARATVETLLECGAVPVINENDTVATSEIRYGDNDRLAARVATMTGADLLVLLSDVDGLYTAPPHLDETAQFLPVVGAITPEIEAMAGGAASEISRGGMKTKLDAGKIATAAGTAMIITSGKRLHPLKAIDAGGRATFFCAAGKPVSAWKSWISGHLKPAGCLRVDAGAAAALLAGKSLLPAGVTAVEGTFARGDTVAVLDKDSVEIARGLASYNAPEAARIAGCQSAELAGLLGHEARAAMIHRNDMVVRRMVGRKRP